MQKDTPKNLMIEMLLPKVPNIELVAIEGLLKLGNHLGIKKSKIDEASLLVTESLINAFEHGTEDKKEVKVVFTTTNNEIVILVEDYGKGFDIQAVEEPDMKSKIRDSNKRGWGMKLMKTMSDDFKVESNSSGTKITMIKNLD